MEDAIWRDYVKGLVRAEIARRNLNYVEVAERLEALGIHETPQNLSNKISRGTFGAAFMVQVLSAIGCHSINIDHPVTMGNVPMGFAN